ncbi:hypothetical protein ANN_08071 [Periplaneta americana]|uniref:Uncharacterized protein n=1 Tax=Periplaneta americana TaxID=6978 RepID=A0ABQ8T1Z7_PERAM|nr:hypothetical protein ANN_08071 [Periplaneta americana]
MTKRVRDTGSVVPRLQNRRPQRSNEVLEAKEAIFRIVDEDPNENTRDITTRYCYSDYDESYLQILQIDSGKKEADVMTVAKISEVNGLGKPLQDQSHEISTSSCAAWMEYKFETDKYRSQVIKHILIQRRKQKRKKWLSIQLVINVASPTPLPPPPPPPPPPSPPLQPHHRCPLITII